jgi:pimeloyl-ACP methyl ester carboxylesterase
MSSTSQCDLSRRTVLAAAAAGATAAAAQASSTLARAQVPSHAVHVLVHAAWHGGWCWKKVAPLLRERGHEVHTPTLTGLGDRAHLINPEIGLETHIQDVVNILEYEDLNRVILVGHSSSGAVITGVAERVPERLAHIVYLDAFVPADGQSLMDLIPPERRQDMEQRVLAEGLGWLLPSLAPAPWDQFLREAWRIADDADRRWMLARLGPAPFRIFKDPVRRSNLTASKLVRTFIRCLQWPNPVFDHTADIARRTAGWRCRELAASHEPFVTHPQELANLLLEAAA